MSSAASELHDALSILATYGEVCTFTPAIGGGARTITAVIDSTRDFVEDNRSLKSQERLSVYVLKDPDNATYGGIESPQMGDRLETSREDGKAYSWSGEEERSDRVSWWLRFIRDLPYELGGHRR